MSQTITILDVGTTRVTCFIADQEAGNEHSITGIGQEDMQGMKRGAITDMDAAANAIRKAVHRAEKMAGQRVSEVFVSLSGHGATSDYADASINVRGHAIDDDDIQQAFDATGLDSAEPGRSIVHAIPTAFSLDGTRGIPDPRGMKGETLGVHLHLVNVGESGLGNLVSCIGMCDLEVIAPVYGAYASGLACLVEDEMDLGVTLIDMGGGTTDIATFANGEMVWCASVPIGGQHVTNDIAKGLSTPVANAQRLKWFFANAIGGGSGDREMIEVPQLGESDPASARQVQRSLLAGIVRPRLEETFEMVRDVIDRSGTSAIAGRRVVLTGGASQLTGIADLASQILDKQVRLAKPLPLPGLAEAAAGPDCAAAAGLLVYATQKHSAPNGRSMDRRAPPPWMADSALGRICQWLRDNF